MPKSSKNTSEPPAKMRKVKAKGPVTEYLLETNGLRVVYYRLKGSPTVTTNIIYHVGSVDEAYGKTGLAHMLEHMLFKPTRDGRLPWKVLENKGAVLNATTWLDRTMYYFNMPNDYFPKMLEVEADRMRNVSLAPTEFEPERTNVLSEYEMYNSRPDMALEWNIVSTAFQSHGYKHDTIGFRSDIESFSTDDLVDFYRRHYHPDNATLIVVGDLDEETLMSEVARTFGVVERREQIPEEVRVVEPAQEGTRRVTLERQTPVRIMLFAFKAPELKERTWDALSVALFHLAGDDSSVLHKRLVETNEATSVASYLYPTADPYLATLVVTVNEKTPYERIERIVFDEVARLAARPLPAERIDELREYLSVSELMSRDGSMHIAATLAEYVAVASWEKFLDTPDILRSLTGAEIRDAAATYFNRKRLTIGTINV